MSDVKDLYAVLGIERQADAAEIKRAYRALAKQYHPDLHPGRDDIKQRFTDICNAYEILSDREKRERYDQNEIDHNGKQKKRRPEPEAKTETKTVPKAPKASPELKKPSSEAKPKEEKKHTNPGNATLIRGRNAVMMIELPFIDACLGIKQTMRINNKTVDVTIPAGTADKQKLALRGLGYPGIGPNSEGDAIIEVNVKPHHYFRRQGPDIHIDIPISVVEAIIGGSIKVPTLDGAVVAKIQPGTDSGTILRLKGRGIPAVEGNEAGDQYVHLTIHVPLVITHELEELIKRWATIPGGDYGLSLRRGAGVN